jgi:hypothetical protein
MKKIIIVSAIFCIATLLQPIPALSKGNQQLQFDDSLNYKIIERQIKDLESGFLPSNHLKSGSINTNLLDSTHFYKFHTSGDSVLEERTLFKYDLEGRIKTELLFKWNQVVNRMLDFKYENSYDNAGRIILKRYSGWRIEQYIGDWIVNGSHYKDTSIAYSDQRFYYYTYNQYGNPILFYRFTFNQYNIPIGTSYICFYNADGIKTSVKLAYTNPTTYIEEYTYDSVGNLGTVTQSRFSKYNYISLMFCYSKIKYEYAYDLDNRVSNIQSFYFSFKANEWKNVSEVTYLYGDNGLLQTRIYSIMDTVQNKPVQADKAEYFYNSLNDISLKTEYAWDKVENQWKLVQKKYYYYSASSEIKSTDITDAVIAEKLPFKIFPNPAKDILWVENEGNFISPIHIYNSNGQCVKTIRIEKGLNTIDLLPFPKGIYILRIVLKDEMKVSKFIVE